MAGCGATGEQHIVLGKRIFYSASFSVEEVKLERPSLNPDDF